MDQYRKKRTAAHCVCNVRLRYESGRLGFLLEHRSAVAAGDGDFAFSPGDTENLLAAGALEVNVFTVSGLVALAAEPVQSRAHQLQKCLVLRMSAAVIAAEGAEKDEEHADCGDTLQNCKRNLVANEQFDDPEQEKENTEKNIQLVCAVAAVHETAEKIAYHKMRSNHFGFDVFIVILERCPVNESVMNIL